MKNMFGNFTNLKIFWKFWKFWKFQLFRFWKSQHFWKKMNFFEIIFFSKKFFHRKKSFRPKFFSLCFLIIYHVHPLQVASCNSLCAAHKRGKRPPEIPKSPSLGNPYPGYHCRKMIKFVECWWFSVYSTISRAVWRLLEMFSSEFLFHDFRKLPENTRNRPEEHYITPALTQRGLWVWDWPVIDCRIERGSA